MREFVKMILSVSLYIIATIGVLSAIPKSCYADEIILHTWSAHLTDNLNNDNYGAGYISDRWLAGTYRNSYDKQTIYFMGRDKINDHWSLVIGVVTGYEFKMAGGAMLSVGRAHIFIVPTAVHLSISVARW